MLSRTSYLTVFRKLWSQKRKKMREMAWDESLASISTALPCKQPLENDPAEHPQGRLKKSGSCSTK